MEFKSLLSLSLNMELLDLEEILKIVAGLYNRKQKGWQVLVGPADSGLFVVDITGPDNFASEIVMNVPFVPFSLPVNISDLPRPLRPIGRGVILEEDSEKFPTTSAPYGIRQMTRKMYRDHKKIERMFYSGAPIQEVLRLSYEKISRPLKKLPVLSFNQTTSRAIGPFGYLYELAEVSGKHSEIRRRLLADVIESRYKARSYAV